MTNRRAMLWGSLLLVLQTGAVSVIAQQADGNTRTRGVIEKLDGQSLTLKPEEGNAVAFHVADDAVITRNRPSTLAAIKPGDYIASAALKGDDGKLVTWAFEGNPPGLLHRAGVSKDVFKVGETVTVTAMPANDGTKNLGFGKVYRYADGHEIRLGIARE